MAISVVLPTYRNPGYLDLCLKSAIENRVLDTTEIIVVVDGYVPESDAVLQKHQVKGVSVLELERNQGMANAINMGVWQAKTEYIFVVNDDQVFPRQFDSRLNEEIEAVNRGWVDFDGKTVLTVNQVEPTGPGMFHFPVKNLGLDCASFQYEEWLAYEETIKDDVINVDGHIFPFAVQKKWFMAIGGMDLFYCSPQVVDWDMFLKWELLGFAFPRTKNLHLYHFGSVVTRKGPEAQKFREREAQAISQFEYKWGTHIYNKPGINSKIPPDRKFRGFTV